MHKKNPLQISSYYKKTAVVQNYNDRRFHGAGGKYINDSELTSLLDPVILTARHDAILEIGAGRGRLTHRLVEAGMNVYALEFSKEMIKLLRKSLPPQNIIHQSAFDPLQSRQQFGVITSLRFFDHFNVFDQYRILSNLRSSLKEDGAIVLTTLNSFSIEGLIASFFPYGRYNFYYPRDVYLEQIQSLGFKVTYQRGTFFLPRGAFLYLQKIPFLAQLAIALDKFFSRVFQNFCALQVYVLKKQE